MNSLLFVLQATAWTAMLVTAGILVANRLEPFASPDEPHGRTADGLAKILVAVGWGFGAIPWMVFIVCLVGHWEMQGWMVMVGAVLNASAALVLRAVCHDSNGTSLAGWIPTADPKVLLGALAVGLFWFFRYDASMLEAGSCLYQATVPAIGRWDAVPAWFTTEFADQLGNRMDLIETSFQHARLGNVGLVAASVLGYDGLGPRVLRLVCGFMFAIASWWVGFALGRRPAWGWFGLVLAGFNPYVLAIPKLDENILSLGFGGTLVPFLARAPRTWLVPGFMAGLVVTMRHALLPTMLAPLLAASLRPGARKAIGTFAVAFLLATVAENLHHWYLFGTLLKFEHNLKFASATHSLLGLQFQMHSLMNWPLYDFVTRTPHNPFPMFLAWPLFLADRLGAILFVLTAIGFVSIWWQARREAILWAVWGLPVMLVLAVLEGWDFQNKMGIMSIMFLAAIAWGISGARFVVARPLAGIALVLLPAIAIVAGSPLLAEWRVPADQRYFLSEAEAPSESPQLVDLQAKNLTDIGLLPDMTKIEPLRWLDPHVWMPEVANEAGQRFPPPLGQRAFPGGWAAPDIPLPGPPVTVEIDFTKVPICTEGTVRLTSEPADIDLTTETSVVRVPALQVPWSPGPVHLLLHAGASTSIVVVGQCREGEDLQSEKESNISVPYGNIVAAGEESMLPLPLTKVLLDRQVVRLRLRSGGMLLGLLANNRITYCQLRIDSTGIWVGNPVDDWGN